jgi:hypothetical protein
MSRVDFDIVLHLHCHRGRTGIIALTTPHKNPCAPTDLISFVKAFPDYRMRREIHFQQG